MSGVQKPTLYPQDYVMRVTFIPLIPRWITPNHLTMLRMMLIPVMLWTLWDKSYHAALSIFAFGAFTDILDGSLARVRNAITPWGILFDPIADKMLVGSVVLLLAIQYYHPWLVFVSILLDILPSLRFASQKYTGTLMMANIWGKIKMVLQCTSLIMLLVGIVADVPVLVIGGEYVFGAALMFAIVALATYSL